MSGLVSALKNINMRNKVWMWNILRAQSVRGWPEDCACVLRLHSHSENLFLVNFPRKGKKINGCFFDAKTLTESGTHRLRTGLQTRFPHSQTLIRVRVLKWWVAIKFTAVVVGRTTAAEGCYSWRLWTPGVGTASKFRHRLCVRNVCRCEVWSARDTLMTFGSLCAWWGRHVLGTPPTPLWRTAPCRGSASGCDGLFMGLRSAWCSSSGASTKRQTC